MKPRPVAHGVPRGPCPEPGSAVAEAGSHITAFEHQATAEPDRLAVEDETRSLGYGELDRHANRVAHTLLAHCGDGRPLVAIFCEHDAGTVIAALGAGKAGFAVFFPETTETDERVARLLEFAGTSILVADGANLARARAMAQPGWHVIDVDAPDPSASMENPGRTFAQDDVAFIRYTSGSSGNPKGAIYTCETLRLVAERNVKRFELDRDDRVANIESYGLSMICATLAIGASVHPFAVRRHGAATLGPWLIRRRITYLPAYPTVFRQFAEAAGDSARFDFVRGVALVGEPVFRSDTETFACLFPRDAVLFNVYGITECPTAAVHRHPAGLPLARESMPCGTASAGIEARILDEEGQPLPPGETGEIALLGDAVAHGYWRRPDLTEQVFKPDPDGGTRRLYLTRDLGFFDSDGCLHVRGRKDDEIKIRNRRVVLGDIEEAIRRGENVALAAVCPFKNRRGDTRLAAYVVPSDPARFSAGVLRADLKSRLPDVMVPSFIVALDAMPTTRTGKVDRRALPAPGIVPRDDPKSYVEPWNDVQDQLIEMWADLLGIQGIGIRDDFFVLGGDSLQAMQVLIEVQRRFGVALEADDLLTDASTVAGVSRAIAKQYRRKVGWPVFEVGEADVDFVEIEGAVGRRALHYIDRATGLRRMRPGVRWGKVTTNRFGFRGPDIPAVKDPGSIRIAFLGNSTTYDVHVSGNDATWPHRVWAELSTRYPGAQFDYVNAGMPGFSTRTITAQYKAFVADLAPDVVVISISDIMSDTAKLARQAGHHDGVHYRASRLARRWPLWAKVETNATIAWRLVKAACRTRRFALDTATLTEGYEERLARLVDHCGTGASLVVLVDGEGWLRRGQSRLKRLRGATKAVFALPYLTIADVLDAHDAYHRARARVATRSRAVLIDCTGKIPADRAHFADAYHFTDAGAAVMARTVVDGLVANPAFRALVEGTPARAS